MVFLVYFLCEEEKRYIFRGLLSRVRSDPIDDSLRGWSWDRPPLEPPYDGIRLGVYEIAVRECGSMRDVYLRHVERVRGVPNKRMVRGGVLHEVVENVILNAKIILYSGSSPCGSEVFDELCGRMDDCVSRIGGKWRKFAMNAGYSEEEYEDLLGCAKSLWRYEASQISASVDRILAKHPYISLDALVNTAIPVVVEQRLDGRFLGLSSNLSADALGFAPVVLDLKTGEFRSWQYMSTTGYALVLEALNEAPIDVGVLVNLSFLGSKPRISRYPHLVDTSLRMRFLEIRDELMELIASGRDPGAPRRCPEDCPYYNVCRGE